MKIKQKFNVIMFIFSILIFLIFFSYMLFLFPQMYVEKVYENNKNRIILEHENFIKYKRYSENSSIPSFSTISLMIDLKNYDVMIANKFFKSKGKIENKDTKKFVDTLIKNIRNTSFKEYDYKINDEEVNKKIKKIFLDITGINLYDFENLKTKKNYIISDESFKKLSNNTYIITNSIIIEGSKYINYYVFTNDNSKIYVTLMSIGVGLLNETSQIIMSSLPLMIAIIILLMIIFSKVFAYEFIYPITKLSNDVEMAKNFKNFKFDFKKVQNNEIDKLKLDVKKLYDELNENYKMLENENIRQEVFLKSTSHQLKTPIVAALLLIDGMIQKIGKYSNIDKYLPELKKQIINMQKIVNEILSINQKTKDIAITKVDINKIIKNSIKLNDIKIKEKNLIINLNINNVIYNTDENLITKIIDNLISNAINYTEDNSIIEITLNENKLIIKNKGKIDEKIINHIFEPFVSGNNKEKGNGLGLYISKFYADVLNIKLIVENDGYEVKTILKFKEEIND